MIYSGRSVCPSRFYGEFYYISEWLRKSSCFGRIDAPMADLFEIDFTNGSVATTRAFTAEESLACSLENPEYCEACQ